MLVLHSNPWDSVLAYDISLGGSFCSWVYHLGELGCTYHCYGLWGVEWLVVEEPYVRLFVIDWGDGLVDGGDGLSGSSGWLWSVPARDGDEDDEDSGREVLATSWSDLYGFTEPMMEALYTVYWSPLDGWYRIVLDSTYERVMFEIASFVVGFLMWDGGIL